MSSNFSSASFTNSIAHIAKLSMLSRFATLGRIRLFCLKLMFKSFFKAPLNTLWQHLPTLSKLESIFTLNVLDGVVLRLVLLHVLFQNLKVLGFEHSFVRDFPSSLCVLLFELPSLLQDSFDLELADPINAGKRTRTDLRKFLPPRKCDLFLFAGCPTPRDLRLLIERPRVPQQRH